MSKPSAPSDAGHLALGLTRTGDVLEKLRWEVIECFRSSELDDEDMRVSESDPRVTMWMAINAASTAWSVVEWLFRDLEKEDRLDDLYTFLEIKPGNNRKANLDACKEAFRLRSRPLDQCHQIAHAAKHSMLTSMREGLTAQAYRFKTNVDGSDIWVGVVRFQTPGVSYALSIQTVVRDAWMWWMQVVDTLGVPRN
jgi:hypothetical protein